MSDKIKEELANATEMPVKIRIDESITGVPAGGMTEKVVSQWPYSYTRTDTIPDVAELQRQNAALKAFARTIINENCFGYGGEVDGLSAQDQAANCGLITPHIVTREMIDKWDNNDCYPEGDFIEGDTIYYFAKWLDNDDAKMPIPSKAEVAREFMDAVEKRTRLGLLTVQDLRDVLKEWEDAESK